MNEVTQFLIQQGYVVLFLWVLFAQLGLPIPIVPILIAAGALAGIGKLNFGLVFCFAFLAALLSDQFWYQIGFRRGGKGYHYFALSRLIQNHVFDGQKRYLHGMVFVPFCSLSSFREWPPWLLPLQESST
jgi:membrane protein DedA with SNARE-associated domain